MKREEVWFEKLIEVENSRKGEFEEEEKIWNKTRFNQQITSRLFEKYIMNIMVKAPEYMQKSSLACFDRIRRKRVTVTCLAY